MSKLSRRIDELGERMVDCEDGCKGIKNAKNEGILPRGLLLEPDNATNTDCVIIGINPGHANKTEKKFYRKTNNYAATKKYFKDKLARLAYYKRSRLFANRLGYENILWTELCKCENKGKYFPEMQTFRHCMANFLEKELNDISSETPLIALGNWVFEAVSLRFPRNFVIGIPHPKGARGKKFYKLFERNNLEKPIKRAHLKKINAAKKKKACVKIFPK